MVLDSKHETADIIITVTAELSMCQTGKFAKCAPEINIFRNFALPISEIARLI
jgi:hypothetical protein